MGAIEFLTDEAEERVGGRCANRLGKALRAGWFQIGHCHHSGATLTAMNSVSAGIESSRAPGDMARSNVYAARNGIVESGKRTGDWEEAEPLVSVIVPAYEAQGTIETTLQSVLAQTYSNIEVIVVDDGSQDGTADIVEQIQVRDSRVRLVRQQNGGPAVARNTAISLARGDFVAPIDADDIWFPDKLAQQVKKALGTPQAGLVYGWSAFIDERGGLTGGFVASELEGYIFPALLYSNFVGNGSVPLIRTACLRELGGYDEAVDVKGCEDLDLYIRVAERWSFAVVPQFLVGYRVASGSLSMNTRRMTSSYRTVVLRVQARHPELAREVVQWGKARFCFYMAWQSMRGGSVRGVMRYLLAACWHDPMHIFHPGVAWMGRWSLRRAARRIIRRLWPRIARAPSFQVKLSTPPTPAMSLAELEESAKHPASGQWARLERHRHEHLRKLCATHPQAEPRETVAMETHRAGARSLGGGEV